MRAWAKRLAGLAAGLATGVAFAGVVFLAEPGLVLTGRTAAVALTRFGSAYAPRWTSLNLSADAFARRRHRYVFSATDFCVADPGGSFSGCFSRLEATVVVFWSRRGPIVERIERLVAISDGARVDAARRAKAGAPGGLPSALRGASVRSLNVELTRFSLAYAKGSAAGDFRAALDPGAARPLSVTVDARVRGAQGTRRLKASATADTDLFRGGEPTFVEVSARADLGPRGRLRASARARRASGRWEGSGAAEALLSTGPLRGVRLSACAGWAAPGSGGELSCRYELTPAAPVFGIKGASGSLALSARAANGKFHAEAKVHSDPIAAWYELTGELALRASGHLDRPLKDAQVSHELRASAKVPRFEELVAFLRDTAYAVPAPFHVLKGPLELTVESQGDPRSPRTAARYVFTTDLAGARERLAVRAAGELAVLNAAAPGRSFEHDGELTLQEVVLELPRLEIGRTPKVFVDARIKSGDEPAAAPSRARHPAAPFRAPPARARLAVKTVKPVTLLSNLVRDPVPMSLDLVATYPPAAAAGLVSFREFDVELFRRNATLDHLNVALSSGAKAASLEGLVRYRTPSAEIGILILGTTEKPRIELTSVPPMKRADIIALLIFGKSPDELDPDQTASVGNTETALESQGFGLASLYLFGATPVEHVGYDSATKTTSVKLRLPGGANLTLGSDFDQSRQLSVRKPLAPHWALQSEFTDQGQDSRAATTFLEWFNRY